MSNEDFALKYDITPLVLGKGAFGVVYEAIKKSNNEQVAVKVIEKAKFRGSLASVRKEAEILKSLDHPNIVHLYEFYENDIDLRMCMEKVTGGELFDRIVKKTFYSESDARELVIVLLHAVKHMHDRSVVHRDIKGSFCSLMHSFRYSTLVNAN
jgi:calcium/calmodulin-dependent protein kinase I